MDSRPQGLRPRTISQALRTTLHLVREESDAFVLRQLGFSLGLLVLGAILNAARPVIYKLTIDAFTPGVAPGSPIMPVVLVGMLVLSQYALGLSVGLRQLVHGLGVQRLSRRISNKFFAHIVHLPMRYHLSRKTGAIGETMSQGLSGCQTVLQHTVFTFLPVVVELVVIIAVLLHFGHVVYLGILGVTGLAYGYTFWLAARQVVEPSRKVSSVQVDAQATLTDSLLNYETVKYFHAERTVCARFDDRQQAKEDAWRSVLRLKATQSVALNTIFALSVACSLGFAAYEVLSGSMTIGDFVLINTYVFRLVQPLEALGIAARDMSLALAFIERMLDVFREERENDRRCRATGLGRPSGRISFQSVTFAYNPDQTTLKGVSFELPPGQTIGIVGSSGSGKTSIVRLLLRLYEPDSGRICLDGIPISQMSLQCLRSAIAVVPQDTVLFNDTIASNIAFGRCGATLSEIEAAARLAHLDEFIASLPEGYQTLVGERGLKLSGGEKQRVAIARAALMKPSVFVFDEATSSLDSRTEREILRNLIELARASTTIVIAHRLATVVHADELLVLDRGSVVERGRHAELVMAGGAYAALWRAQNGPRAEVCDSLGFDHENPEAVAQ